METINIDKRWMQETNRASTYYIEGIAGFIEFVVNNGGGHKEYSCPCKMCRNGNGMATLGTIAFHLFNKGIDQTYTVWSYHGEKSSIPKGRENPAEKSLGDQFIPNRMENLVDDAFEFNHFETIDPLIDDTMRNLDGAKPFDDEAKRNKKFKSLHESATEPLYPSCPKGQTTLYTIVKLNNLKTQCGWSDNSVTLLLELLKEILPEGNTLPVKYPDMKKMIKEHGMDYDTYDACINDCILYWKEHKDKKVCPNCNAPRYKIQLSTWKKTKKVPQKTLRHFPLIPRLKRLYSIPWIANAMTWHFRAKSSPNIMRHPVDSSLWQSANMISSEFTAEPRNVRLGMATDGFNPFGSLSSSYSCWPVIIVPYNLPPSLCMKREFSMLLLLISGPKAPSKDIDVYLEPLVDELNKLWLEGVTTYDSFTKSTFTLTSILLWAIHDFPAYGTLSGCVTRGYKACPVCAEGTVSHHLPNSKKMCYMGHRRFLPKEHRFREDKTNFNKEVERGLAPWRLSGSEVKTKLAHIKMIPGKFKGPAKRKRKNKDEEIIEEQALDTYAFYRRSILFDLAYWKEHTVRHNLDVMHIVKNVTAHLLNTILDVKGQTKDGISARKDMESYG